MKFTVQSKELLRVLNALLKVIQKKNSIPILDTVLLDRAEDGRYTLTGSSAENMLVMAIDITPEAGTAFRKVCLNAQQLQAVIATLPEQPVEISVEDNYATTIRYQGGQFNLMSQDAECYPLPASPAATRCAFSLPTAIFLPSFKSALPCSAHDEMRPQMSTVALDVSNEGVTFVACTTQMLYKYVYTHGIPFLTEGAPDMILIPNTIVSAIEYPFRNDEMVSFSHDGRQLTLSTDDARFIIRDQEGKYPNYNSVIPKENPYHVTLPIRDLTSALKRVSLMASDASQLVAFRKTDDDLTLTGEDIDFGTSAREVLSTADCTLPSGFAIGIRASSILQLLGAISTENVRLEFSDPSRPLLLKEDATNSALIELAMPLLLNA